MNSIDAHAHIQMKEFDRDRDAVLTRMRENGVGAIVVGVDYESSRAAVALAEQYDFLWATVGLHPHDNLDEVFDMEAYRELARSPKVVGVGECGLDYFRLQETKERQYDIFQKQIALALEVEKPLMLHSRPTKGTMDAYEDMLKILDTRYKIQNTNPGNVHFFVGDQTIAQQFIDRGFTLSFTGVVTFARDYDEVIRSVPQDRILAETDCPFVAPVPHRGERNEPAYVTTIAQKLAEIREEDEDALRRAMMDNAQRVFGI